MEELEAIVNLYFKKGNRKVIKMFILDLVY